VVSADVLVHNFRPGVMERLGLGSEQLLKANPRLVYCHITGYGDRGPLRDAAANDLTLQSFSGLMSFTGTSSEEPSRVPVSVVDLSTGLYAAIAILGALLKREHTGEGGHVTLSLLESIVAIMSNQI